MLNQRALTIAATIGTVAQVAMVVAGHTNSAVKATFAVGGMGLSLLAGVIYDKTLVSTQPRITIFERHGDDAFTGRSNIINDAGERAVIEVKYRRVGA